MIVKYVFAQACPKEKLLYKSQVAELPTFSNDLDREVIGKSIWNVIGVYVRLGTYVFDCFWSNSKKKSNNNKKRKNKTTQNKKHILNERCYNWTHWELGKSEPQMGFEPTTLPELVWVL